MDPSKMKFCQSCIMPLSPDVIASNDSEGQDYCKYCYKDGKFVNDKITMEEMIDFCVPKAAKIMGKPEDEVRKEYVELFPKLKRWQKA
mgnify:CR=1 FL=1